MYRHPRKTICFIDIFEAMMAQSAGNVFFTTIVAVGVLVLLVVILTTAYGAYGWLKS